MALSEIQIKEKLLAFAGWQLTDGQIRKTYGFKSFQSAMEFVNQVAMIAEHSNHHPDIDIKYTRVTLTLSTHSEGGVTEKDFALAKEIESAAINNI